MNVATMRGPRGDFYIPGGGGKREQDARFGMQSLFGGREDRPDPEYSYPRATPEDVRSIVNVGVNLGAYLVWAMTEWWPGRIAQAYGYDPNAKVLEFAKRNCEGLPVELHAVAVTTAPSPVTFHEFEDWGASRTNMTGVGDVHGITLDRIQVPTLHPRDLPPADVLQCDAEGVGHEVFFEYPHWSGVKVASYETHHPEERRIMQSMCEAAGLRMVRGNPAGPDNDVRVWVR